MYPMGFQECDDKLQTGIWTVMLVIMNENFKFFICDVRIMCREAAHLKLLAQRVPMYPQSLCKGL